MGLYLPFFKDEIDVSFFILSLLYLTKQKLSIEISENYKDNFKMNKIKSSRNKHNKLYGIYGIMFRKGLSLSERRSKWKIMNIRKRYAGSGAV